MKGNGKKRKKSTIFKIFLIPLIFIMLLQSAITIGTLIVRRTAPTLEGYSSGMMNRLVENRKVILQNEMNQRWASVYARDEVMGGLLERFLQGEGVGLEDVFASEDRKNRLLETFFPECLDILQNNSTTGVFLVLTGDGMQSAGEYDGFFIRDSDPDTNPANYSDLLLERGGKQLSRNWNIPLDTNWTTRFHMDGQGESASDDYFYEPWRAGAEHADADTKDLGYWSMPFSLEKDKADSYEMITYSLPLRYQGRVYGVLGVEISSRNLCEYLPAAELNATQQSGYMLAVKREDGSYLPLVGKGILYDLVRSGGGVDLEATDYDNLSRVGDVDLDGQGVYAVVCPLKLYSNNVPYENTEWVLLGLDTEKDLFGMSRLLYVWMVIAVLIGLGFGVFGIYFMVRHLTKPVQCLMQCISKGREGLSEFKPSNILEVDALYDVVTDLTERQKEAENILLEEKERYKVALESSKDIFFSYDLQSQMLDIVNHETMSGRWQCPQSEDGFINPEYIYGADREETMKALRRDRDNLYAEFRMRWPNETGFAWVALTGKAVYDTDGRRWKLVGSIRDIQEQKEREAEQLRKNTTDQVTGLPVFGTGMERLKEARETCVDGFLAVLYLDRLKESEEKNGIVFGDMILEETGSLIRGKCQALVNKTGLWTDMDGGRPPVVAFRLNKDEFVLWLGCLPKARASAFVESLLEEVAAAFPEEVFPVRMYAGLAQAKAGQDAEQLIRRAKLARSLVVAGSGRHVLFYEDVPKEKRPLLPALQGCEVNSLGYSEDVGLVSVALNLFGKGSDFPAQMTLMIRKIGRFYHADGVLVSLLRADFNSNYLNYQWHQNEGDTAESVRKYKEEEKEEFYRWMGREEVRYFSEEDSGRNVVRCFLSVEPGQRGILLPMYDSGNYMGNVCILGLGAEVLEDSEERQNLAELGRAIQSQLNQQQYDIASKAKSEFLSRMSHEIRTPMNGIIGMTAIALQQDQSQERVMDCLQKIRSSSDYLLGLINDILDMSKIESGKMKLEAANFGMDGMLGTIRELIMSQAAVKHVNFVQEIELAHHWFVADQMRISQVLINLLGNAVKFTPADGTVTLTVREEGVSGGEVRLYFAVGDTGIGIAKEEQERIFRSFEQASGTNPSKQQGTGLGLSISNRLVQMMGSNILVDSEPGKGSTFSFSVALALGESEEGEDCGETISFEGCRVLVVEDNDLNAEIAQCLLEDRGFEVECVFDGAQAVERIRTTPPDTYDVILMDIMMPVMNGLDAARAIRGMEREDCHTIPIIAMSANAFDEDLKKSVACGMNGHLSKPVEVDKLYQTLDKVIRGGHG